MRRPHVETVGLVALLVVAGGCGGAEETATNGGQEAVAESGSAADPSAAEPSPAEEEPVSEEGSTETGSAADCPETNRVSVAAKHSAHEGYAALGWDDLQAVFAKRVVAGLGADGTAIKVYMATKEVAPDQVGSRGQKELLGEEGYVVVTLTNGTGGHPDAATYTLSDDSKAAHRLDLSARKGGTGYSVRKENWGKPDSVGEADVAYVGEDRICGTFHLDDPWRTIEGAFDAEIHDTLGGSLARAGS